MANAASSPPSPPGAGPSSTFSSTPPAGLPEELVEEFLLRFPPGEPASLLRATLVCRRWRRLICSPSFRRRFREFHRTPPMLGMFCRSCVRPYRQFVPTTAFRQRHAERARKLILDARHGRVLLLGGNRLVVWDPITDEEWKVPFPRVPPQYRASLSWAAAVLCSAAKAAGCHHLDCHGRPFIVVFVGATIGDPGVEDTVIYTYSSDAAAWSEPTCSPQPDYCEFHPLMRSVLVGNTLYFGINNQRTALKYNVQLRQMSLIPLPSAMPLCRSTLHTTTEDGGLLLAIEHESKLYVWLRKDATWEQSRVIELKTLLPVDADFILPPNVVGSTDDLGTILMRVGDVVYAIDLKTCKGKKVYEGRVKAIVPFMSFYTPELEAAYVGQ